MMHHHQHRHLLAVVLAAALLCAGRADAAKVCLLRLDVQTKQSPWRGTGNVTAPTKATVETPALNATGHVFLRVPAKGGSCPPALTASNVDDLLQQSSLEVPVGSPSLNFLPVDIRSKVLAGEKKVPLGRLNFLSLGIGLTGNEPLGPNSVTVGSGSVAEAKAAAQSVCTQVLMLNGTLDLSNDLVGSRTADVTNVAFNRTLDAGISVKKAGDKVSNATLFLRDATMALDISPENTPGVEFTRSKYELRGDVVATADLSSKGAWIEVDEEEVAWGSVPRKDAPVVVGGDKPIPKAKVIGVNSTMPQQCKPSRIVDGTGSSSAPAAGGEGAKKSGAAGAGAAGALWAAAAATLLAAMLL